MFYAKLTRDGAIERFPYELTDLRFDNPNTSFPSDITNEIAASFGVVPVAAAIKPQYDYTVDLTHTAEKNGDNWVEVWISTPASPEEIAQRTNAKSSEIRMERNGRLADCDWTQLPDAPVDRATWATYRQALRDVTAQPGFPWSVTWPVEP